MLLLLLSITHLCARDYISNVCLNDPCSPWNVIISHHAMQNRRKATGGGGSEGLWIIRPEIVGVTELSIHMRVCWKYTNPEEV